jgi:hypothetical protein
LMPTMASTVRFWSRFSTLSKKSSGLWEGDRSNSSYGAWEVMNWFLDGRQWRWEKSRGLYMGMADF